MYDTRKSLLLTNNQATGSFGIHKKITVWIFKMVTIDTNGR